jgi:hypothetical protein
MFKSRKLKEMALAYKRTFDSPDGKKVLADLFKSCHMMNSTMDSNPHETAFNEGARSVVLRILKTINTDVESLSKMYEDLETEEQYE